MKVLVILGIASLLVLSESVADAAQSVHFLVHVPADTLASDSIFVAGSLTSVGGWKADGLKLVRQIDGTYAADIDLDSGQTLEFKITRGSWANVEKNADGSERVNRLATIDPSTKQIEITVECWANGKAATAPSSTVVGQLELRRIESKSLGESRTIRVWLPAGYDADSSARYGVLYMQDGQNCFDQATSAFGHEWQIDETLTSLIADKKIPPLIVVGVDNSPINRINEFTYDTDSRHPGGGGGEHYSAFLLSEVKPFVDQTYRTRPDRDHTMIGGSSLGGLISLDIARRHPDIFGGIIAMSPSLWWADEALTRRIEVDAGGLCGTTIWLDIGSREDRPLAGDADPENQRTVEQAQRLDASLTREGIVHRLTIDHQHAEHNEVSWASRFPKAIEYLMEMKR